MPTPMDTMLGLVIVAIGLLTMVIAFSIAEPRKRLLSYGIAGLITLVGLVYYVTSEMRGFKMRQRISEIQQRRQVNLEDIQRRLKETQAAAPAPTVPPSKKR